MSAAGLLGQQRRQPLHRAVEHGVAAAATQLQSHLGQLRVIVEAGVLEQVVGVVVMGSPVILVQLVGNVQHAALHIQQAACPPANW